MGRASADYHIWYWDNGRFRKRLMAYMSHPGDNIILDGAEYLVTDLHWTPGAAPHCVQTVSRVDWQPEWSGRPEMRWRS
jgi:hypothetical protein